jgi:hypothetical protein
MVRLRKITHRILSSLILLDNEGVYLVSNKHSYVVPVATGIRVSPFSRVHRENGLRVS